MIEFFIAMKHIKERKRQSVISIAGIVIGVTVLTVALAISNGLDGNMIKNILSMTAHIKTSNSLTSVSDYEKYKADIEKIDGVEGAVPKYSTQGIIKYEGINGNFVSGVIIEGLREEDAVKHMELDKKIIKGKMDLKKADGIIIGKELFAQIGAKIGDKIKLVSSENKEVYFEITGIFQSGFYDYDTSMVIVPLTTIQMLSDVEDIVTSIDVKLKDVYSAKKIAEKIREKTGLNTKTWGELNKNLLYALSLEKTVMVLVLSLIVIISGFVVAVILNMLVKEKTKDIGILRAIGFSSNNIMKIFMIEGIVLGGTGIIFGSALSWTLIFILKNFKINLPLDVYYLEKLPVELPVRDFMLIILVTIIIVFIASIQPAYRASKLTPVEAMRYE